MYPTVQVSPGWLVVVSLFYPINPTATVAERPMDTNNLLRQMLMIGIGTTSLVAEKLKDVTDEWVKEGKINPDQAKSFADDLMAQLKQDQSSFQANFDEQMQRQLRNILQDLGVPRQAEMDELRGRLDRLERQMRDLENKLWR